MKFGIGMSAALHSAAIGAALFSLPEWFDPEPVQQQVMLVELVTLDEKTSPAPSPEPVDRESAPEAPKIESARAEPPPPPESHRPEPVPRAEARVRMTPPPRPRATPQAMTVREKPLARPRLPEPEATPEPAQPPRQVAALAAEPDPALPVPAETAKAPPPPESESELPPDAEPALRPEPLKAPEPEAAATPTPPAAQQVKAPEAASAPLPKTRPTPPEQAKPRKKTFSTNRLAALLDKKQGEPAPKSPGKVAPTQMPKASQFSAAGGASNTPLTLSEIDHIRHQIQQCWSVPAGVRDAADMRVRIHVSLRQDGSLINSQIVSTPRLSEPNYRAAAESAQRAVHSCSPLKDLPVEKYQRWRELTLTFDPKELLGG